MSYKLNKTNGELLVDLVTDRLILLALMCH